MNSAEYANLGDDFVMDQEELQRKLSEEELLEIQQRVEADQGQQVVDSQLSTQAPTGSTTPEQATQPEEATAPSQNLESKFKNPDGSINYEALDAEAAALDKQDAELLTAIPTGLLDWGVEALNFLTGVSAEQDAQYGGTGGLPKLTKYEDNIAQSIRNIASVIGPTMGLTSAGTGLATKADKLINNPLGKMAFVKFIGQRGIEAGASVAVGAVSDQYTEDNMLGQAKKALPPQFDFIPDSWATLDTDSADVKRQKNINEDLSLGLLIPFLGFLGETKGAIDEVKGLFRKAPTIVGESDQAVKYLADARPVKGANASEELVEYIRKQEADLDELGYYNQFKNADVNIPKKGVHDLYEWNETGLRSVDDFGIVGASVDAARIAANKGTVYGRLGNFISTPALRYGVETPGGVEEVTVGLAKQLQDADRYRVDAADWAISFDEIQEQGEKLVLELFDPTVGIDEMRRILDPVITKNEFGAEVLTAEGYTDAMSTINQMVKNYSGMDVAKAQAYTATSMAGQISDLSEGIRLNKGSLSVENAQEKLLDNINFLQQLVGSTRYYATEKKGFISLAERALNIGKKPEQIAGKIKEAYPQALRTIQTESEKFTESWRYLQENRPDILDSFLELYEISDGKINTIAKMNDEILHAFTKTRLLFDGNPDSPNIIVQAVRSNYFNSILSDVATSSKALYGNISGLVAEPITYFAGALSRKDLKAVQRGWMAYSSIFDTQKKALPYAGKMFMKASQNPNSVAGQTRLDLIIKQEEKIAQYRQIADAESARGNHGFKYLVDLYDEQMAMAADPVFRFVPNSFTGFDAWTGATLANAQARFRAMDELDRLGEAATPARIKELADVEYNSMFDSNGIITDQAVKYNTADIALNLDTGLSKQIDGLIKVVPGLTPFLTFPKTMMNVVRIADDFVPAPLRSFQSDVNELAYTSVKDFMSNPELVETLLAKRGHPVSRMDEVAKLNTLIDLKNRTLGRKAIGSFITSIVIGNVIKDKLFGDGLFSATGDGSVDRQLNRARQKNSNFKTRSVVGPDGVRFEYGELLGPGLSNWVAMVANIADNFDMLGETMTEQMFEKAMFILSASLTDDAGISALRPLVEVMSGNKYAANRWLAGQVNTLGPLGGARNGMGRILDGSLKELNNDLISHIANRNQYLGMVDNTNRLPTVINPVSGEAPNQYGLFHRIYNHVSPLKIHPSMTKEEKFLYDIEYDVSSAFKTRNGVELTGPERAALNAEMGKNGSFRNEIKKIMGVATERNTIQELKEARRPPNLVTSDQTPISKYDGIHVMLRDAQKRAEEAAFTSLNSDMRLAIEQRILTKGLNEENALKGIIQTNRY